MSKTTIYLAMPTYDAHEVETVVAAGQSSTKDRFDVEAHFRKGCSLLALAFNEHWAEWLNDDKGPRDWFVLLHGDIEPDPLEGWLEAMVDEADAHGLDAIHAVAALKDNRALTSTGIGPLWHEPSLTRKLAVAEQPLLPWTFTLEDCVRKLDWPHGNPFEKFMCPDWRPDRNGAEYPISLDFCRKELCLLANTGCLAVRYSKMMRRFPGWNIFDRLAIVDAAGRTHFASATSALKNRLPEYDLLPEVEGKIQCHNAPEDWRFSRWCARHGLKVGGTQVVRTAHWGRFKFLSRPPADGATWGTERRDEFFFKAEDHPLNIGR